MAKTEKLDKLKKQKKANKLKIMVLGKTGMLGHTVFDYLSSLNKYDVIGTDRHTLDVDKLDGEDIELVFSLSKPDVVINCIGIINKYADDDPYLTFKINGVFPHLLAHLAKKHDFRLIHISSDCYLNDDVYGKSKNLGEVHGDNSMTIRTSIIGFELGLDDKAKNGLLEWFLSQPDKSEVNGYTYAFWDGVTALQLSKFIEKEVIQKKYGHHIINYRSQENLTKYNLLLLISQVFNKNVKIIPDDSVKIDRRDIYSERWCEVPYIIQLEELKAWESRQR